MPVVDYVYHSQQIIPFVPFSSLTNLSSSPTPHSLLEKNHQACPQLVSSIVTCACTVPFLSDLTTCTTCMTTTLTSTGDTQATVPGTDILGELRLGVGWSLGRCRGGLGWGFVGPECFRILGGLDRRKSIFEVGRKESMAPFLVTLSHPSRGSQCSRDQLECYVSLAYIKDVLNYLCSLSTLY